MAAKGDKPKRRRRGFERAAGLLGKQVRKVGETRGFAESRLLTHWADIVGSETASMARPVKISYAQGGLGATLTLLTTGAVAPMLQASLPKIREKVNACYGYAAISRIRITQTAAVGFAEEQAGFEPAPPQVAPEVKQQAAAVAGSIADEGLRRALESLGQNVLTRNKTQGR